jgi:hypothetical protein
MMHQFGTINAVVTGAIVLGNTVEKGQGAVVTPISDSAHHLTLDALKY